MTKVSKSAEFVIHATTPIGFGKLKGQPHERLIIPENYKYAQWIIDQGGEFRYNTTRLFILRNIGDVVREFTPSEYERKKKLVDDGKKLSESDQKSLDSFESFLAKYKQN